MNSLNNISEFDDELITDENNIKIKRKDLIKTIEELNKDSTSDDKI